MNLGLATAKRRAQDRSAWRLLVATATSSTSSWRRKTWGVVAAYCALSAPMAHLWTYLLAFHLQLYKTIDWYATKTTNL